ncbi:hypothetical protein [Kineococcus sp. G2]|uniref:hypothetical protein n=1 Tax=Kineococcus sp. G2 TaxID=3127484 RepID=UPI00301C82DA
MSTSMPELAAALQAAEEGSTTGGGWPGHLLAVQQDAWMLLVEVEASLVGLTRTRLAGGRVEHGQVREALRALREPVLRSWPADEVERWRRVAELLSAR